MSASECDIALSWITLERDVYYRQTDRLPGCAGCRGSPVELRRNQFYVLGDNSSSSSDSRYWGIVPGNLILGPLRFIFWPPERWENFGSTNP